MCVYVYWYVATDEINDGPIVCLNVEQDKSFKSLNALYRSCSTCEIVLRSKIKQNYRRSEYIFENYIVQDRSEALCRA